MWDNIFGLNDFIGCQYIALVIVFTSLSIYRLVQYSFLEKETGVHSKHTYLGIQNKVRRKYGDIPPIYPNGWFGILETYKVGKSRCFSVTAFGQELAVFRDDGGKIHVVDAYCPHLGANLAVGGHVAGECIVCPFHGWKFSGTDGLCTGLPYSKDVPKFARVKAWVSTEINGWIFVWYHAENIQPTWNIPEIPEITNGLWKCMGENEHIINTHIQEISENSADFVHFQQIHEPFWWNGATSLMNWVRNEFIFGSWTRLPNPDGHIGQIIFAFDVSFFGVSIPHLFRLNVTAFQIGPGIAHFNFEGLFLKFVVVHTITPVEAMVQRYTRSIYMHWALPRLIGTLYMLGDSSQIERDIVIWKNKTYVAKPLYSSAKEDSIIARHRRWYSQFYSEHSPRFNQHKHTLVW